MSLPAAAMIKRAGAGVGIAGIVLLAACGGSEQPADPPSNAPSSASAPASSASSAPSSAAPTSSAPSSSPATGNASTSNTAMLKAGASAEDKASGNQKLTSIESEDSNSRWEITLTASDGTEYEVDVSPDGSQVQRGPVKQNDDANDLREQRAELAAAKINYREAAAAVTKAQAGRINELNLDTDRGNVVWEANVVDAQNAEHAVKIDAGDGKLVSNTIDD